MFISDSIIFIYYNYILIFISQLDSSLASEQDYSSYRSRAGVVTPAAQTQEKQNKTFIKKIIYAYEIHKRSASQLRVIRKSLLTTLEKL